MDKQIKAAKALVHTMMDATGLTATELARAAGLVPSTLTRFLNSPVKHTLSARTIAKLAAVTSMPSTAVVDALGLKDGETGPQSFGVNLTPGSVEYVDRAQLWRSWCALNESQKRTVATAISVMILANENGVTHDCGPDAKRDVSH